MHEESFTPTEAETASLKSKIELQQAEKLPGLPLVVWCTDLDGTRFMNENHSEEYINANTQLLQLADKYHIPVNAVTGRALEDLKEEKTGEWIKDLLFDKNGMPFYEYVACAVGTEVYKVVSKEDGSYALEEDLEWKNKIENEVGFVRERVYPQCIAINAEMNQEPGFPNVNFKLNGRDSEQNTQAWADYDQAISREETQVQKPGEHRPQPYKIASTFEATSMEQANQIGKLYLEKMKAHDLGKFKINISHHKDLKNGRHMYFMDVLPVTKSEAVDYLLIKQTKGFPDEQKVALFSGDSSNDTAPLTQFGGALVGGDRQKDVLDSLHKPTKTTKHFMTFLDHETHATKILYVEPEGRLGPVSLVRAFHALSLLSAISVKKLANVG